MSFHKALCLQNQNLCIFIVEVSCLNSGDITGLQPPCLSKAQGPISAQPDTPYPRLTHTGTSFPHNLFGLPGLASSGPFAWFSESDAQTPFAASSLPPREQTEQRLLLDTECPLCRAACDRQAPATATVAARGCV